MRVASDKFETPKGPIEILPPEHEDRPVSGGFAYSSGFGRVKIVKLGPLTSLALFIAISMILALGFIFLSGALLFILPIAGLLAAGAAASALFGNRFNRLR
jgi:hypothetical protein